MIQPNDLSGSSPDLIALEGDLTVEQLSRVAAALRSFLRPGDLTVDLSRITKVDTLGLQLLFSATKEAERQGGNLSFRGAPSAFLHLTHECGWPNGTFPGLIS